MTLHATTPGQDIRDPFAGIKGRDTTGALCAGHDPELWFDGDNEQARRICHRCPLQPECGKWGFERREWGVWAGVGSGRQQLGTKKQIRRADEARRERVLALVADGCTTRQAAEREGLSPTAVKRYQREAS